MKQPKLACRSFENEMFAFCKVDFIGFFPNMTAWKFLSR